AGEGITILLSSHQLLEVEHLCNRVAIVDRGRVRYEGDLPSLLAGGDRYRLLATDPAAAAEVCRRTPGVADVETDPDDHTVRFVCDRSTAAGLSLALAASGIGIHALVPAGATLEQLFFDLTDRRQA
ncbi:MAG TPA: hypothetical protein VMU66_03330, partial [Gaiellales bacterium]|nr:hypothetical protein [Gaiellales bacterium]